MIEWKRLTAGKYWSDDAVWRVQKGATGQPGRSWGLYHAPTLHGRIAHLGSYPTLREAQEAADHWFD